MVLEPTADWGWKIPATKTDKSDVWHNLEPSEHGRNSLIADSHQ